LSLGSSTALSQEAGFLVFKESLVTYFNFMEGFTLTREMLHAGCLSLAEGFVREGLIVLPELSDAQLVEQIEKLTKRFLRPDDDAESFEYALTFDHTDKLLSTAKAFEDQDEWEFCSLFYMLWIEHQINLILRVTLRRRGVAEDEAIAMVRRLSIRDKLSGIWKLLGLEAVSEELIKVINCIEECRNGFVHFKWQHFDRLEQEDKVWNAVNQIEKVISALKLIEEKHVFYGERKRLAESCWRLKEVRDFTGITA
jgi:hypothetical protein